MEVTVKRRFSPVLYSCLQRSRRRKRNNTIIEPQTIKKYGKQVNSYCYKHGKTRGLFSTDHGGGKRRSGNGAIDPAFFGVLHRAFLKARLIAVVIPQAQTLIAPRQAVVDP
jgi:hypothetical protein